MTTKLVIRFQNEQLPGVWIILCVNCLIYEQLYLDIHVFARTECFLTIVITAQPKNIRLIKAVALIRWN